MNIKESSKRGGDFFISPTGGAAGSKSLICAKNHLPVATEGGRPSGSAAGSGHEQYLVENILVLNN